MNKGSFGTVEPCFFRLPEPLALEGGRTLKDVTLAYETYGSLNREKNNAVLICHALTGDAHAAGWHEGDRKPGWWDSVIGPGKALDTEKYFVICSNVLGGCRGSTGPASFDPETGKPYGMNFPVISIADMVRAQNKLVEHLGISKLFAVVGGSMGGMQVLQWCVSFPEMIEKAIAIATTASSSPQQIAFDEVGRLAIMSDPDWRGGDYYQESGKTTPRPPAHGLALARMIGHITYLSEEAMQRKFGRKLRDKESYGFDFSEDFQVQSYLHHQGLSFTERFDANSYLYITKAVDYFDLSKNGSLREGLREVKASVLVISVSSDWLYPPYQSKELAAALSAAEVDVTYREIDSPYGHDAFLLEGGQLNYIIQNFLSHMLVKDVMVRDFPFIREGASIEDAACIMFKKEVTHLPVVTETGALSGIVTSWDISKAFALKCKTLEELMTRAVITASPGETVESAAGKMETNGISALPVVDEEGRILGIIGVEGINRFQKP